MGVEFERVLALLESLQMEVFTFALRSSGRITVEETEGRMRVEGERFHCLLSRGDL